MLRVIVNADDFGLNGSCTEAIARSFREGLITDTTMVANGDAFDEAAELAQGEFDGKVGIHFNLTEGKPLTNNIKSLSFFCHNGIFHDKINRLKPLGRKERQAVYEELSAQCRRLKDAGIKITHADSHHHIHTGIFIAPIVLRVCKENDIRRVRLHRNIGKISPIKKAVKFLYNAMLKRSFKTTDYMGGAEDINLDGDMKGIVEIMVHPDFDAHGNIIDRRAMSGPLLSSVIYWNNSKKTDYSSF